MPFFIEELLAAALDAGPQRVEDQVPDSFAGALRHRLEALGPTATRVLRMAAVLGRWFDWTLLPTAATLNEDEVLATLRAAVGAQVLIAEDHGASLPGFRFRHSLTREAILADLLPKERGLLARDLLVALEALGPDVLDVQCELAADLSEASGDPCRAARFLLEAGRRSLARGALRTSEATHNRARELADDCDDVSIGSEVDEALLETLALAGKTDAALEVGSRLRSAYPPERHTDIHLRLARAAVTATRWDTALHHLDRARAALEWTEATARRTATLDVLASQVAMGQGRLGDAAELAQVAFTTAEAIELTDVACEALEVLGRRERTRDLDRAEALFERARRLADSAHLRIWSIRALHELGTIRMLRDLEVDRLLQARSLANEAGALATAAVLDLQLASTWLYRFEALQGLEAARQCVTAARKYHLDQVLPSALVSMAACHAALGQRGEMESAAAEARQLGGNDPDIAGGVWLSAYGMYALLQEQLGEAMQALERGMEALNPGATLPHPMRGMWALLRTVTDQSGEEAQRIVRASGVTLLPVNEALVRFAEAVTLGRAGRAAAAESAMEAGAGLLKDRPGARGLHLLALRWVAHAALIDGWGHPLEWLRLVAAHFEPLGQERVAAACAGLLRRSGVAVPRRRRDQADVPEELRRVGVTQREVEVLVLLGERLSNREIGERLVLSPRTVEKHIERLMAKTQAASRAELGLLARERLST
jgi:DNA-binding CsgD family transcriptional regulator